MTDEDDRYCSKHPNELVAFCDLCLHEMRLATREECAALTQKMQDYRRAILNLHGGDEPKES